MFKKFLVSIFVVIILGFLWFSSQTPIFSKYTNKREIYLSPYSSTPVVVDGINHYLTFIKYGEACIFTCENFNLDTFLNEYNAKMLFSECVEGKLCVYAYSPKLKYRQNVKGEIINLHVVISDKVIKVGSPLIYGSY